MILFIYKFVKTGLHEKRNPIFSNKGVSTLEIVIIAAILIGLALIFKDRIMELITYIFDKIFAGAEEGLDFGITGE